MMASVQLARELEARLPGIGDIEYPVLRFLDRYGDTRLNALQVEQLLLELGQLREKISDSAALGSLDALSGVARAAQREPHSELTFIGD